MTADVESGQHAEVQSEKEKDKENTALEETDDNAVEEIQDHPQKVPHGGGRNHNRPRQSREKHTLKNKQSESSRRGRRERKQHQQVVKTDKTSDKVVEDPRNAQQRMTKATSGRNTESFDPASTLVRPDLRILVGSSRDKVYSQTMKHDDCIIVPELFGPADNWSLYHKLLDEMKVLQQDASNPHAKWISWHEGAHLISKSPKGCETFQKVIDRLCEYFKIRKESIGTRFNYYRDSVDWKPFHHDSAAFNPQRAKNQNITVGASFGATRELAFIHATPQDNGSKVRLYFPQPNNGVFSFGRDANIVWKHGINALHPEDQDGKGRISIILWGLAQDVLEEEGSPPLLGSDGQGPHAKREHRNHKGRGGGRGRGRGGGRSAGRGGGRGVGRDG